MFEYVSFIKYEIYMQTENKAYFVSKLLTLCLSISVCIKEHAFFKSSTKI